jgi:hypothetical protein
MLAFQVINTYLRNACDVLPVPTPLTISPVLAGTIRTDASQAPAGLACTIMEEIWKDVLGYEGTYQVSSMGRVKSLPRHVMHAKLGTRFLKGRIMNPGVHSFGYPFCNLFRNGKSRMNYVHTMVLEAFVGKRPDGMICCHNDGNPSNSTLGNLRWGTPAENNEDMALHGTRLVGMRQPNSKLSDQQVLEIRASTMTTASLARLLSVSESTVRKVRKVRAWKCVIDEQTK